MIGVIDLLSPASVTADKGWVDHLPLASEEQDVRIAHPGVELVTPALFFNWVQVVAEATGAVRNAFDHTHRISPPFPGKASLLLFTTSDGDEQLADTLALAVGANELLLGGMHPAGLLLRSLVLSSYYLF